jgi:hypothetical protein
MLQVPQTIGSAPRLKSTCPLPVKEPFSERSWESETVPLLRCEQKPYVGGPLDVGQFCEVQANSGRTAARLSFMAIVATTRAFRCAP